MVGEERASDAVEALRLTSAYQFVFLDGPPGALLVTEDAIRASSLALIPMRASGLDLGASQDCISLCQEIGTPFLVVINDKNPHDGRLVDEARSLLFSWKVPIAQQVISHRVPFVNAVTTGRTGPEKNRHAAEEIDALWLEIRAAVIKATKVKGVA
jgi:chromosome partitioning protein